jgi:hypothetical protein
VPAATTPAVVASWCALAASVLFGFAAPLHERAYQQWKQAHVALVGTVALCAQSALILLPASVLWLYGLLWMRGASALAVVAITTTWAAAGHLPAAMHAWRPAAYARHHDAIWALANLACALMSLGIPALGVLPHFQLPGLLFRNMLMPAIMVYVALPALLQLAPLWQLVVSCSGYITASVSIAMAAEGAFPIGNAGHAVLVAASVGIACVLEWRSRSRWLHARSAAAGPAAAAEAGKGKARALQTQWAAALLTPTRAHPHWCGSF